MVDENVISELVRRKVVTDTFRRLVPDKKEKLYKTALLLFGKYGYDGLSVDQYCLQAKISKGSFFQYYPSKSHLLEFTLLLFDQWLLTLVEKIRKGESKVLTKDRLKYLLIALSSKNLLEGSEKRFYLFVINALHHSEVIIEGINAGRHFNKYIKEIISRGIETKEIRADFRPDLTNAVVAASFDAFLHKYFLLDTQPDEETVSCFMSLLMDGIKS